MTPQLPGFPTTLLTNLLTQGIIFTDAAYFLLTLTLKTPWGADADISLDFEKLIAETKWFYAKIYIQRLNIKQGISSSSSLSNDPTWQSYILINKNAFVLHLCTFFFFPFLEGATASWQFAQTHPCFLSHTNTSLLGLCFCLVPTDLAPSWLFSEGSGVWCRYLCITLSIKPLGIR